jgi:glycosyltransferase involved in cell wall biosynthesis
MTILLLLAALILLFNLYATLEIILGTKKLRSLKNIEPLSQQEQPKVSVIIPACNEQDTIQPALRSMLSLEYKHLEIIVINDRSTDHTGEVLRKIQKDYPELQIIEITELPEGWLGKNHALHQGAMVAKGEYFLFTDADILFAKSTLSRAMSLMVNEQKDHLVLIFKNIAKGWLLNAMMLDAAGGLFFLFKPWKVSDSKSKHFIGAGAFNLVKKSVYQEIGGHDPIKMHPIDDVMLGKIIKKKGYRQECLSGYDFLQVHWYESPRKMINGLMKNIFALYNFRVTYALAAVLIICVMTILPVWGAFFAAGLAQLFFALSALIRLASCTYGALYSGTTLGTIPFSLLTPYINIYIILKGVLTTLGNKGIDWRGTHYPLDRLKKNQPIL